MCNTYLTIYNTLFYMYNYVYDTLVCNIVIKVYLFYNSFKNKCFSTMTTVHVIKKLKNILAFTRTHTILKGCFVNKTSLMVNN